MQNTAREVVVITKSGNRVSVPGAAVVRCADRILMCLDVHGGRIVAFRSEDVKAFAVTGDIEPSFWHFPAS